MFKVKVSDVHPGKYHDGMELILAHCIDNKKHTNFLTGFREDTSDCRGMFSTDIEPIQHITYSEVNGGWIFTANNLGVIPRDKIDELLSTGFMDYRIEENGIISIDMSFTLL